jgi:hypothetical protein
MKANWPDNAKVESRMPTSAGCRSRIVPSTSNTTGERATRARVSYRVVCILGERWRLCGDNNQWIVERFVAPKWRQVAFTGSCKAVLERVLREKGVHICPDGRSALDCLPVRFLEWHAQQLSVPQKLENDVAPDGAGMRGVAEDWAS